MVRDPSEKLMRSTRFYRLLIEPQSAEPAPRTHHSRCDEFTQFVYASSDKLYQGPAHWQRGPRAALHTQW